MKFLCPILLIIISLTSGCTNVSSADKKIISDTIVTGPPELILGTMGYADSKGVKIWYEVLEPKGEVKGTLLLIMGIGQSALVWPTYFTQPLIDQGYRVIRFDHRDVGMSDRSLEWNKENAYTLDDMSADAIAILDTLNISAVHVLGVSMGGLIAQNIAQNHPNRVSSLSSIMSAKLDFESELPQISSTLYLKIFWAFARYAWRDSEAGAIKLELAMLDIINGKSDQHRDTKHVAERVLYEIRFRNGINTQAIQKHSIAIAKMENIVRPENAVTSQKNIPTLIVHGKLDPVIPFSSGVHHADLTPKATTLWIDNMGHDIAPSHAVLIHNELFSLFERETDLQEDIK